MTIKALYPNIIPSLSLDFANTEALDPRITFARASTARAYDGKTVAKAEENLLVRSEQFDNASWTKTNTTVTANATTAPDGASTADALNETAATTFFNALQDVAVATGSYVWSGYVKANGRTVCRLACLDGALTLVAQAEFDLTAVTSSIVAGSGTASIVSVGSGWYRVAVVATSATAGTGRWQINPCSAAGTFIYAGDVTKGLFVWGAQLEQRSTATAYTPTTTQPITNYVPVLQSAANNVARFDHNPVTGESLGLLIEEQRTNLVLRSEEFDNASWLKGATSIQSNTIVAPDGTLTGDKLVENTANAQHYAQQTITVSSGVAYTASCYVKAAERNRVNIFIAQSTSPFTIHANVSVDLSNGTVVDGSGIVTSIGNGWYRISITGTTTSTGEFFRVSTISSGTTTSYTGDGYSGIYIWGAQLEIGAFPTSYIPTVASQVTRSADAASMTGANFSSWFSNAEGTLYGEALSQAPVVNQQFMFDISDNTISNTLTLIYRESQIAISVVNGVSQASLAATAITQGSNIKIGYAYKENDFAASRNGGTVATDTAGRLPICNTAFIGKAATTAANFNGSIKKLAFYPKRLANAELQALTQN
jgi:hypothetical protein